MSNAMLLQRIILAEDLHVTFDDQLNVKCNVAAKDCTYRDLHVTFNRSLNVKCNVAAKNYTC
uniref:Uncharacterized protein n=1 Tax=viral metagenome TaxID=1070528 RepID=A0A6C0C709_9ZZZZ